MGYAESVLPVVVKPYDILTLLGRYEAKVSGETILVVDDEPKIVKTVRAYLENAGFRVVVAGDGQMALTVFRHEKPALVVLDLGLPGMVRRV